MAATPVTMATAGSQIRKRMSSWIPATCCCRSSICSFRTTECSQICRSRSALVTNPSKSAFVTNSSRSFFVPKSNRANFVANYDQAGGAIAGMTAACATGIPAATNCCRTSRFILAPLRRERHRGRFGYRPDRSVLLRTAKTQPTPQLPRNRVHKSVCL